MSPSKRGDNSAIASPDRQILPVLTGKGFRSGAARFAGHSIEEYAFKNTHKKNTQLGEGSFIKTDQKIQNQKSTGKKYIATYLTNCQMHVAK